MALPWLLLLETALYVCCFICGIITSASLTICQGDFGGRCMLYGSVKPLSNISINVTSSSAPSVCYFVTAISVCVAIFCFSATLFWVYSSCMGEEIKRERIWMNFTLIVIGVFLFFLLVTGCILRVGRDKLCESVISEAKITRCDEAQAKSWAEPLIGSHFYSRLLSAETAVWVNFFCWMIIAALVVIQRRRGSEYRSQQDDPQASSSETEPIFNHQRQPQ